MYIADLHIHSRFSRATSKEGDPEHLRLWARRKGIRVVGTGDFTHPEWRKELEEKLEETQDGLYRLKKEYQLEEWQACGGEEPLFVVSGEISSIYKKNGKVRKVHNVILLPGLEEANRLAAKLEVIGNIHSDGRPILGLDSRDLLEILLDTCPEGMLIPAHIWTPHFSLLGAFSGFDTVEECFEDLTPYVHAVETGLSSDPPMNWRLSMLDRFQLVSSSDAHSPAKLGREATLLEGEPSWQGIKRGIETGDGLGGTIEFYPEEGKYHMDGHRKCHLCLTPAQTRQLGGRCPVCGKKITIGVYHRAEELADRPEGYVKPQAKGYESLVPLPEVIASAMGFSVSSVKTARLYQKMLTELGPEFEILRQVPVEAVCQVAGLRVAEGIQRLRSGQVEKIPGYDGEYGVIRVFSPGEAQETEGQMDLFSGFGIKDPCKTLTEEEKLKRRIREAMGEQKSHLQGEENGEVAEHTESASVIENRRQEHGSLESPVLQGLNPAQEKAVRCVSPVTAVIAGPGTGKTRTLVSRISWMITRRKIPPEQITAVTFTKKAAAEMEIRLDKMQRDETGAGGRIMIGTFHSICFRLLNTMGEDFSLADETTAHLLAEEVLKEHDLGMSITGFLREVSLRKSGQRREWEESLTRAMDHYEVRLKEEKFLDFDDLLLEVLRKMKSGIDLPEMEHFRYLLVDEFQDISPVQYCLIREWKNRGQELFVIGDPDQSIYGFRGSDAECFRVLEGDFPAIEMIHLDNNYRSTRHIIDSAEQLISHNPGSIRQLRAVRGEGEPIRLIRSGKEKDEAVFVAHEIKRMVGGIDMIDVQQGEKNREGSKIRSFSDIAVLYRTHRQADLLEKCLQKEGIPYQVAGREDYLKDPFVRGTLEFFMSVSHPEQTAMREGAVKRLWGSQQDSMADQLYQRQADKYRPMMKQKNPGEVLGTWMEEMGTNSRGTLGKLRDLACCFTSMEELLDTITFGEEGDIRRMGEKSWDSGCVTLMTLHGSKGLEFPVVILYGVRKGTLPLESEKHSADTEEERRLFFVGMTRAQEELLITTSGEPSLFLEELPAILSTEETAGKRRTAEMKQMSLFDFI